MITGGQTMAGIMDMIGNRDQSVDKSIAETTMMCLKEMKKQSTENVELVKSINSLVEAGINKIKKMEFPNAGGADSKAQEITEAVEKKIDMAKEEVLDEVTSKMDTLTQQLDEKIEKENNKCYKNIESILEEFIEQQEKVNKSHSRWLKVITWFLVLIAALLIANIVGVF